MEGELNVYLEYAFKGLLSLAAMMMLYILKDFKLSLKELTKSLAAVTLSLNSLLIKDENKAERLAELKMEYDHLQADLAELRKEFNASHMKHSHEILDLKYRADKSDRPK